MNGDQLNLDTIEARANAAPSGSRCVCSWQMEQARYIATAREDALALVAEVRRLRVIEARIGELPGQWIASTADGLGHRRDHWRGADYAEGVDAGVEGCADVLSRTLAGE